MNKQGLTLVNSATRVLALLGMLLFSLLCMNAASACTIANWTGGNSGLTDANAKQPTAGKRYAGKCGLEVPVDATARYVADGNPTNETRQISRFYVFLNNLTIANGSKVTVYRLLNAGNTSVLDAEIRGVSGQKQLFLVSGAVTSTGTTLANGWHAIELDRNGAVTTLKVDGTAKPGIAAGGVTGGIETARLGAIAKTGAAPSGLIYFDAYVANRTTAPGLLLAGDANNDGNVNSGDNIGVLNEFLGGVIASGTPDCNADGNVNSGDIVCIINKILGP
ncbi:MAG: hypothetical protein U1F68_10445 [Gammaproteobacteria bacterium]